MTTYRDPDIHSTISHDITTGLADLACTSIEDY
jgi:hypothetical protein